MCKHLGEQTRDTAVIVVSRRTTAFDVTPLRGLLAAVAVLGAERADEVGQRVAQADAGVKASGVALQHHKARSTDGDEVVDRDLVAGKAVERLALFAVDCAVNVATVIAQVDLIRKRSDPLGFLGAAGHQPIDARLRGRTLLAVLLTVGGLGAVAQIGVRSTRAALILAVEGEVDAGDLHLALAAALTRAVGDEVKHLQHFIPRQELRRNL